VEPNQILDVDRLPAEVGSQVELTAVLLLGGNGDVRVGTPTVEGARVVAEVVEHGRDRKIVGFKYKAKTRYRRKWGHRQDYTRLAISRIEASPEAAVHEEAQADEETRPTQRRRARRAAPAEKSAPESSREGRE